MQVMQEPSAVVVDWFREFIGHIVSGDAHALTSLFSPNGWLRDHLVFEWNCRSLKGHTDIEEYLTSRLPKAQITNLSLEDRDGISPQFYKLVKQAIEAAFIFETPLIWGRGYVLLHKDLDDSEVWKALSVYFSAVDIKGYEEDTQTPSGYYDDHRKTWMEAFQEKKKRIEEDPHVIILGAAQNGLNTGARFHQMNIPTLILEQSDRVGDTWRQRYANLTLHTPKSHHTLLYTKLPSNWPLWTPRDKVANMLEQYAINQELIIWNRSTILPTPFYDSATRRWTVQVLRNGEKVTLRPYHIILATGLLGKPYIPPLLNAELFSGPKFHAMDYKGHSTFQSKHVIVVGAAQSALDISHNLALHDVSVTLIQRSSLIVRSLEHLWKRTFKPIYPINADLENADLRFSGLSWGLFKEFEIANKEKRIEEQKDMIEGLLSAGLNINEGEEGAGQFIRVYERLGGYCTSIHTSDCDPEKTFTTTDEDIGAADLIIKGKIKIKHGEPKSFTRDGLIFKDDSFLQADAVIFATGYEPARKSISPIFGEEIANRITPVWGFNEVHELRRTYSPSGHPGIWWAIGDFYAARYLSKMLGIQIKARLLGLITDEDEASNRCFV